MTPSFNRNTLYRLAGMLVAASLTAGSLDADESTKRSALKRWDAKQDLVDMRGTWRLSQPLPSGSFSEPDKQEAYRLLQRIIAPGAMFKLDGAEFRLVGDTVVGSAKNDMNRIEFRPQNDHWVNTQEPNLVLTDHAGNKARVSYTIGEDKLRFRFPANSCSRSGYILRFERVRPQQAESAKEK